MELIRCDWLDNKIISTVTFIGTLYINIMTIVGYIVALLFALFSIGVVGAIGTLIYQHYRG